MVISQNNTFITPYLIYTDIKNIDIQNNQILKKGNEISILTLWESIHHSSKVLWKRLCALWGSILIKYLLLTFWNFIFKKIKRTTIGNIINSTESIRIR